jgi:hypothetical protein
VKGYESEIGVNLNVCEDLPARCKGRTSFAPPLFARDAPGFNQGFIVIIILCF